MAANNNTKERYEKKKKKKTRGPKPPETLLEGLMTFYKLTTCHGPRHILRNRGSCFGILWTLITVFFFVVLVIICQQLIDGFFQREVKSQVSETRENGAA